LNEPEGARIELEADRHEACCDSNLPRRFGDYELLEEIARGGMGIVYKARQVSLDRIIALKMLLFGQYTSEEFVHRFRIEASAAASLQHPNIVAIHEVGVHQGQHYFAMDFVDGPNLAQFVRNQPLPAKRAATYAKIIAEAIQFAHQRHILHRDLKPSNILIDSNDQPRITDFGLAKKLSDDSNLTLTGQVLGSPSYIPPEQASGRRERLAPPSDVYSIGAILYHALTARPPCVGETLADTLQQVLHKEPVAPRALTPNVPADLETICLKCLEKEPAKRFATAQELADELGRFLRDEPILARPVTQVERAWRWCRRNPTLASSFLLVLLLLLALGIGSSIAALRIRGAQQNAEENLYVKNVHQAMEAINSHDLVGAKELLRAIDQSSSQRAMRGWEWRHLANRSRPEQLKVLGRHDSWLAELAISPDHRHLATISEDGMTRLWDLGTEKMLAEWSAHFAPMKNQPDYTRHSVVFTPDGSTLITSGDDRAIRFWTSSTPIQQIHQITNLPVAVNRLAISPDGHLLAGQGEWRDVYVWRLTKSAPDLVTNFIADSSVPSGIGFSPDGRVLLVGWVDQPILRYDFSDAEHPSEIAPLTGATSPFAFSPDGRWLATAGPSRHFVRRWVWPQLTRLPDLNVQGGMVDGFAFSQDTRLLVAGLYGGQINAWEVTNRAPQVASVLHGHEEPIASVAFGLGGDQVKLVSISCDKTIRLWNPFSERDEMVLRLGTPVLAVEVSSDGNYLATVTRTPIPPGKKKAPEMYTLQLWDWKTRSRQTSVLFDGQGYNPRIVFSPDSQQVAVSGFGELTSYRVPSLEFEGRAGQRSLVFAPDESWLAYIREDGIVKRASLDGVEALLVPGKVFQQIALSPDARLLAGSTEFGSISLWDAHDGRHIKDLLGHTLRVPALCFTANGKTLVSAGWDGRLGIWDLENPSKSKFLRGHNNDFTCAVVSHDGKTIATGGDDPMVRLWNVDHRQEVAVLQGHSDTVNSLSFSTDGQWLVSGSDDGTVRFWHAPPIEEITKAGEQGSAP
jgi:WD40 repeat protein/serine/threonine protein kinase